MSEKEKFYKLLNSIVKAPVSIPWYIIKKTIAFISFLFNVISYSIIVLFCFSYIFLHIGFNKLKSPKEPINSALLVNLASCIAMFSQSFNVDKSLILNPFVRGFFIKSISKENQLNILNDRESTEAIEIKAFDFIVNEFKTKELFEIKESIDYPTADSTGYVTIDFYFYTIKRIQNEIDTKVKNELNQRKEKENKEQKLSQILNKLDDL